MLSCDSVNPTYAAIFLNSSVAKAHVEAEKVGIAQGHFNVGSMRTTPLPLPPLPEQQEIVRRVAELVARADVIETRLTDRGGWPTSSRRPCCRRRS
ncbi:MAG: restriction endonuclease subunit S, partial [Planctomycetes bacterium]|nr:restriction endonuclease subunit S [Planctomycetota bacterium]